MRCTICKKLGLRKRSSAWLNLGFEHTCPSFLGLARGAGGGLELADPVALPGILLLGLKPDRWPGSARLDLPPVTCILEMGGCFPVRASFRLATYQDR